MPMTLWSFENTYLLMKLGRVRVAGGVGQFVACEPTGYCSFGNSLHSELPVARRRRLRGVLPRLRVRPDNFRSLGDSTVSRPFIL